MLMLMLFARHGSPYILNVDIRSISRTHIKLKFSNDISISGVQKSGFKLYNQSDSINIYDSYFYEDATIYLEGFSGSLDITKSSFLLSVRCAISINKSPQLNATFNSICFNSNYKNFDSIGCECHFDMIQSNTFVVNTQNMVIDTSPALSIKSINFTNLYKPLTIYDTSSFVLKECSFSDAMSKCIDLLCDQPSHTASKINVINADTWGAMIYSKGYLSISEVIFKVNSTIIPFETNSVIQAYNCVLTYNKPLKGVFFYDCIFQTATGSIKPLSMSLYNVKECRKLPDVPANEKEKDVIIDDKVTVIFGGILLGCTAFCTLLIVFCIIYLKCIRHNYAQEFKTDPTKEAFASEWNVIAYSGFSHGISHANYEARIVPNNRSKIKQKLIELNTKIARTERKQKNDIIDDTFLEDKNATLPILAPVEEPAIEVVINEEEEDAPPLEAPPDIGGDSPPPAVRFVGGQAVRQEKDAAPPAIVGDSPAVHQEEEEIDDNIFASAASSSSEEEEAKKEAPKPATTLDWSDIDDGDSSDLSDGSWGDEDADISSDLSDF